VGEHHETSKTVRKTTMAIHTSRLQLLPFSPEQQLALIEGPLQFEERSGLRAAAELHDFFVSDDVSPAWLAQLRASLVADPWVHGFAVIHRENGEVIGSAAFKGPPDEDGLVEIAYGIVTSYQGRGYATEAAAGLLAFAFGSGQVHLVRARTLPEPNASTRVLAKCGFAFIGDVVDPEDGLVWRWERGPESS
jgi:RimJ/RimL family protein N-acetyltransferase